MTKKQRGQNWRLNLILILFLAAGGFIVYRLFDLQVVHHHYYLALAQAQHQSEEKIKAQRGKIYLTDKDQNSYLLATNREYYNLYAVPLEIQKLPNTQEETETIAQKLEPLVPLDRQTIMARLQKADDPFEPLAEKLTDEQYETIKQLQLPGIYFYQDWKRWYPQGKLAAQLVGFLGQTDQGEVGQYGLEGYWQQVLAGQSGQSNQQKDATGDWIGLTDQTALPVIDGSNLYLTLDQNIQFMIEKKLGELLEKWQALSGSIIVMRPKTGEILGMCSQPGFDPNQYATVPDINVFLNPVVQSVYEPGSIFKPITMSAGIDSGRVTPQTTFTDTGSVKIGGYTITNAAGRSFGQSTMTNVLEQSINTGIVFVQQKIPKADFREYIESFAFGRPLGIDLTGELPGNISNLKYERDIDYATIAFGQGIAVTPLQMINAIAAIANNGQLMRPFVVEKIVGPGGNEQKNQPTVLSQPISSQTASKLTAMLVSTVENGYDKVKVPGYYIAGKTGTAQIPDSQTGGYQEQYVHSFIGFAPAYDPQFIILIKMDQPHGVRFASSSLAPTFGELTKFMLNYLEIPPDFSAGQ